MIMVYPHDADWDDIATLTGDPSWNADNMRRYFQRWRTAIIVCCTAGLPKIGINPTRHGFKGWLQHGESHPDGFCGAIAICWRRSVECALEAIKDIGHVDERVRWLVESQLDPNDWRTVKENSFGMRYTPLTTRNHARVGSRERVLEVARRSTRSA